MAYASPIESQRSSALRPPRCAPQKAAETALGSHDYPHQDSTLGYTRDAIQSVFDAADVAGSSARPRLSRLRWTAVRAAPDHD